MENIGFVQIPRNIFDWEYADVPEYMAIYFFLFHKANYEDKRWHGITIHRGELVISLGNLSKSTGVSIQKVRTCLDKLESTQKITRKTTNKYTLISVKDYVINTLNNKQITNEQQQLNKENKEINKYSSNFSSKNTSGHRSYTNGATLSERANNHPRTNPMDSMPAVDPENYHKRIIALKKRVLRID